MLWRFVSLIESLWCACSVTAGSCTPLPCSTFAGKLAAVGAFTPRKSANTTNQDVFCFLESQFLTFTSITGSSSKLCIRISVTPGPLSLWKVSQGGAGVASQAEPAEWVSKRLTIHLCRAVISANPCPIGTLIPPKTGLSLLPSNHWRTLTSSSPHEVTESSWWSLCLIPPQTESSLPLSESSCPGQLELFQFFIRVNGTSFPTGPLSLPIVPIRWDINIGLISHWRRASWVLPCFSPTYMFSSPSYRFLLLRAILPRTAAFLVNTTWWVWPVSLVHWDLFGTDSVNQPITFYSSYRSTTSSTPL